MKLQGNIGFNATLAAIAVAVALGGCSAGGGDKGTTGGGTNGGGGCTGSSCAASTMTLALSTNNVTSSAPATVTATVKDSTGKAVVGTVVSFVVNGQVGKLGSTAALTNSSGVATTTLAPASASTPPGADTLTATAIVGTSTLTQSAGYQVSTTSASITSFTSAVGTGTLDPYAQTTLSLTMSNVSTTAPVTLAVSSDCVAAGKATISPTTVTNTTGSVTFTYQDTGGCGAVRSTDNVVVTPAGGSVSPATLQMALGAPTASSLTFAAATPSTIYLKGSGLAESSTVTFKVVDVAGNPLPNQKVMLGLNTFTGGLQIDGGSVPVQKISNSSGIVSVIVNSGTVPTPVRVRAVLGTDFNASGGTVSSGLVLATGLPTQANFSMSQSLINIEGWNYDDVVSAFNILAADRSGNPVPDGTAITFWSEGGQIAPAASTATAGGIAGATVNFVSSDYRPPDGHVTVLAYALGEESFIDQNGNNVWDAGEPFQDLGDVVKDVLSDGVYDSTTDSYVSLLGSTHGGSSACVDNSAAGAVLAVGAAIPSLPGTCDGTWSPKVYVRRSAEVIFSTSEANPIWVGSSGSTGLSATGGNCPVITRQPGSDPGVVGKYYDVGSNGTWYSGGSTTGTITMLLTDANGIRLNPMPSGTTVTATSDDTASLTVTSVAGQPVVNSPVPTGIQFSYTFVGGATTGTVSINVTTAGPKFRSGATGAKTTTPINIRINKAPAPTPCTNGT